MVVFNGRSLMDALPVRIIDVKIGSINPEIATIPRPLGSVNRFVRAQAQEREITIDFVILEQKIHLRSDYAEALRAWAWSNEPAILRVPQRSGQHIFAMCTDLPEISGREWWEELSMTFAAYDPFFISNTEKQAQCDGRSFFVGGTAEPLPVIRASLPQATQSPSWTLDGKRTIYTVGEIGPGMLEINLAPDIQTITLGGISIADKLTFQADFFNIPQGNHTLLGPGTLYWKEQWR